MEKIVIRGPCKLDGRVSISRSRNSSLNLMASTILFNKRVILNNLPKIIDVDDMKIILKRIGVIIEENFESTTFDASTNEISNELSTENGWAPFHLLGPLLARKGSVKIHRCGGGRSSWASDNSINTMLNNLEMLGANVYLENASIKVSFNELIGTRIVQNYPSTTATFNSIVIALIAKGKTILENAARDPEIIDLINFLNLSLSKGGLGEKIQGYGTNKIIINGIDNLNELNIDEYEPIADYMEAAIFTVAGLITQSEITVDELNPDHLLPMTKFLLKIGAKFNIGRNYIRTYKKKIFNGNLQTEPYPGFPSNILPVFLALLTRAHGKSKVWETTKPTKFNVVAELRRLGADIELEENEAIINQSELNGGTVNFDNPIDGSSLILAALVSHGETIIENGQLLKRTFECMVDKFQDLGVDITTTMNSI